MKTLKEIVNEIPSVNEAYMEMVDKKYGKIWLLEKITTKEQNRVMNKLIAKFSEITGLNAYKFNTFGKYSKPFPEIDSHMRGGINLTCKLTNHVDNYNIAIKEEMTEKEIDDFIKEIMLPCLLNAIEKNYFTAHGYTKYSVSEQAIKYGMTLKDYVTSLDKVIDFMVDGEKTSFFDCKDKEKFTAFIKECYNQGKIKDTRTKYLESDEALMYRYLSKNYVTMTENEKQIIIKRFQYQNSHRWEGTHGILDEEDFKNVLDELQYINREVDKIVKKYA